MIQILVPVAIYGIRLGVNALIENRIEQGITEASSQVWKEIQVSIIKGIVGIIISLIGFLACWAVFYFSESAAKYWACSLYLSYVVSCLVSFIRNTPLTLKFIIVYRFNLKEYLRDKIYDEAYQESEIRLANSFGSRLGFWITGRSSVGVANEIADQTVVGLFKKTLITLVIWLVLLSSYRLIFTRLAAPLFFEGHFQFTLYQALVYPITYFF